MTTSRHQADTIFTQRRSFTVTVCTLLLLISSSVLAATYYIRPTAEIPLRRGQGSDYKILAIVENGTPVEILEDADPWAKVVTDTGKEGWILKRFLTQDPPLQNQLEQLSQRNQEQLEELTELRQQFSSLTALHEEKEQELSTTLSTLQNTALAYEQLKQDTADVISIKENLTKSMAKTATLEHQLEITQAENSRLKASNNIRWFLAGGGTLIFGCLVGMFFSRSRRKRPSLY